jgi:hypothetical protein
MSENENPVSDSPGRESGPSESSTTEEHNPYANLPQRNPEPEYKSEKDCDPKRKDK